MTTTMTEFEDYLEFEDESYEQNGELEFEDESEYEDYVSGMLNSALGGGEVAGPLSEQEELEFANQLLEVTNEQELEQFIGNVFRKAVRGVRSFARSSAGRALGGALKSVARKALPVVGGAIGSWVAPGIGTAIGTRLGSMASRLFEFENESAVQELELEMARRVVRIGAAAARNVAAAGRSADPRQAAHRALIAATRRHAPAALPRRRGRRRPYPGRHRMRPRFGYGVAAYPYHVDVPTNGAEPDDGHDDQEMSTGKWVRRGRSIVIHGV
ncbi:uncharacterized protein (DUF697 family) [Kibdelosporangium banguiense]|uniref:Uncharacterized protein (DUF697 family) n=1 Tax=Kibdelosporangium banguiense TaxID=1365924 RepID=A0ABS4TLI5_9PSEU|nr:hypothetical protein [Kibdelosporangium banguiense]MBP2324864.1 uncharacterized protein (DUF697 family) [Kibdelosporangium banguiense]